MVQVKNVVSRTTLDEAPSAGGCGLRPTCEKQLSLVVASDRSKNYHVTKCGKASTESNLIDKV